MIFRKETFMTIKEKLLQEFGAAISAVFGDIAEKEYDANEISAIDVEDVARKVKFYMDL